jgi:hypothetical protein
MGAIDVVVVITSRTHTTIVHPVGGGMSEFFSARGATLPMLVLLFPRGISDEPPEKKYCPNPYDPPPHFLPPHLP